MIPLHLISARTKAVGSGALIVVLGGLLLLLTCSPVIAQTAPGAGGDTGNVARPDQKPEEIDLRIVALRHANAARTAEIVNVVINDVPGKPGVGAAGQAPRVRVRLRVEADDRTNSLILRGPRELLQTAVDLVVQLDDAPDAAKQKEAASSNDARLQKLEAEILDLLNQIKALREEIHPKVAPGSERAR
jgi:hypothetical protein